MTFEQMDKNALFDFARSIVGAMDSLRVSGNADSPEISQLGLMWLEIQNEAERRGVREDMWYELGLA